MRASVTGRTMVRWSVSLVLLLAAGAVQAGVPQMAPGQRIYDGETPLDLGMHTTPTVADWNNNGRPDLIAGQYTGGYIYLYLNLSAEGVPAFNGGTRVLSSGSPITTSYG